MNCCSSLAALLLLFICCHHGLGTCPSTNNFYSSSAVISFVKRKDTLCNWKIHINGWIRITVTQFKSKKRYDHLTISSMSATHQCMQSSDGRRWKSMKLSGEINHDFHVFVHGPVVLRFRAKYSSLFGAEFVVNYYYLPSYNNAASNPISINSTESVNSITVLRMNSSNDITHGLPCPIVINSLNTNSMMRLQFSNMRIHPYDLLMIKSNRTGIGESFTVKGNSQSEFWLHGPVIVNVNVSDYSTSRNVVMNYAVADSRFTIPTQVITGERSHKIWSHNRVSSTTYSNNMHVAWVFQLQQYQSLQLYFREFDTELGKDFVSIFDGVGAERNSVPLREFSGNSRVFASYNSLYFYKSVTVTFRTDASGVRNGFEMQYYIRYMNVHNSFLPRDKTTQIIRSVRGNLQFSISSSNFRQSNSRCTLTRHNCDDVQLNVSRVNHVGGLCGPVYCSGDHSNDSVHIGQFYLVNGDSPAASLRFTGRSGNEVNVAFESHSECAKVHILCWQSQGNQRKPLALHQTSVTQRSGSCSMAVTNHYTVTASCIGCERSVITCFNLDGHLVAERLVPTDLEIDAESSIKKSDSMKSATNPASIIILILCCAAAAAAGFAAAVAVMFVRRRMSSDADAANIPLRSGNAYVQAADKVQSESEVYME